jgi:hypothetical protein
MAAYAMAQPVYSSTHQGMIRYQEALQALAAPEACQDRLPAHYKRELLAQAALAGGLVRVVAGSQVLWLPNDQISLFLPLP